ncbi:hypothetical protein GOBAR_DD02054 [Gossypium barbadense]|nr:hypothetical protein GOBAR_DD02054 [Gossypium barbadense]
MAGIFSVSTSQKILCPPKAETPALTPFSAIVPARFIAVPRLHNTHITLETIHEEENEGEISMEVPSIIIASVLRDVHSLMNINMHECFCGYKFVKYYLAGDEAIKSTSLWETK